MPIRSIGVPWFTATQWPELRKVAADRSVLPERFADFESIAGWRFDRLRAQGYPVEKILIDVSELAAWCRAEGRPISGAARAEYAAMIIMLRDTGH
jgi:hypothetical protein